MNRVRAAYRALWDKRPVAAFLTLFVLLIASIAGLVAAVFWYPAYGFPAAVVLLVAVILLRFTPGGGS